MKKRFLFMSVLASLFMAGCSQEEIAPNDDGNGGSNTSYMAVNLVSSDATGSRAAAGYEDGSEAENHVEKVRFYFFTANGAITNVKLLPTGTYVNYYDWTPKNGDQIDDKDDDDIESILSATIVINTKDGDKLPQRIVAVLNPPTENGEVLLGIDSKSLTDLKKEVQDYAASNLTKKDKFVMFNSVYGKDGAEACAVPIESKHLQKEPDLAKKNPVTIYVERSVAKVCVALSTTENDDNTNVSVATSDKLLLKDKNGDNLTVGGQQVYLKLSGWALTAETDEGRLVKAIDPGWTSDWWNGAHRSFWAINSENAKNKYDTYNNITTNFTTLSLYTNENALDYNESSPIKRTKVILKGRLCKEDGSNFTIVRHLGAHFADEYSENPAQNLPALKANILAQLTANGYNYYFKKGENEREQIGVNDLKIVIADQLPQEGSKNNCYVYAQLTDVAGEKTWYKNSGADETSINADEINGTLKNKKAGSETEYIIDRALVWKDGMTYYYYEIIHHRAAHQTNETATKGVVRNHIYKTTVTKIAGLGTPVYKPDEVIYPEKPDENDHYIAAQINILSWRVVNNSYELEW